ncbi:hypothetical protein D3C81_1673690 [compost metagenome]
MAADAVLLGTPSRRQGRSAATGGWSEDSAGRYSRSTAGSHDWGQRRGRDRLFKPSTSEVPTIFLPSPMSHLLRAESGVEGAIASSRERALAALGSGEATKRLRLEWIVGLTDRETFGVCH